MEIYEELSDYDIAVWIVCSRGKAVKIRNFADTWAVQVWRNYCFHYRLIETLGVCLCALVGIVFSLGSKQFPSIFRWLILVFDFHSSTRYSPLSPVFSFSDKTRCGWNYNGFAFETNAVADNYIRITNNLVITTTDHCLTLQMFWRTHTCRHCTLKTETYHMQLLHKAYQINVIVFDTI